MKVTTVQFEFHDDGKEGGHFSHTELRKMVLDAQTAGLKVLRLRLRYAAPPPKKLRHRSKPSRLQRPRVAQSMTRPWAEQQK